MEELDTILNRPSNIDVNSIMYDLGIHFPYDTPSLPSTPEAERPRSPIMPLSPLFRPISPIMPPSPICPGSPSFRPVSPIIPPLSMCPDKPTSPICMDSSPPVMISDSSAAKPILSPKQFYSSNEQKQDEARKILIASRRRKTPSSDRGEPSAKRWKRSDRTDFHHHHHQQQYQPPQQQSRNGRSRLRQVFHHNEGIVVLAANGRGDYTLTNGVISISEDRDDHWITHLMEDIKSSFKVSRLFVVDEVSRTQWRKAQEHLSPSDPLKNTMAVLLTSKSHVLGLCTFCQDPKCLRWKAIVGGIQRLYQFPIDPIRH